MGCRSLDGAARGGNKTLNCGSIETTRELFFLGLDAGDDRDSEEFFIDTAVEVEDFEDFLVSICFEKMCSVAFLPQKFTRPEEGLCGSQLQYIDLDDKQDSIAYAGY